MKKLKSLTLLIITASLCVSASGQGKGETFVCKQEVFATAKPLPKLNYKCRPDEANDYDESILKRPERIGAIRDYMRQLQALTGRNWWDADVSDLNLCYFSGRAGELAEEEREKFRSGDYQINLFGNSRMRLVLISDPCFQTGYNGSNAFLLYRQNGKVTVTEVLDGYYSRADNSVALDFARLNAEQLIEISTTTGGLLPYITNYYFAIDKKGRAVPKRLFKEGKRLTNKITSAMIPGGGEMLPQSEAEMEIIKGNKLANSFNTYGVGNGPGGITDASGSRLQRRVYKWNGQFYSRLK
jgi:hypothetical protein